MKRGAVIGKIKKQAKKEDLFFATYELTNHTGIKVGETASTLSRHSEIDDVTAGKFFDQFAAEFGKGWWR